MGKIMIVSEMNVCGRDECLWVRQIFMGEMNV